MKKLILASFLLLFSVHPVNAEFGTNPFNQVQFNNNAPFGDGAFGDVASSSGGSAGSTTLTFLSQTLIFKGQTLTFTH